jgi:hypothetical protein
MRRKTSRVLPCVLAILCFCPWVVRAQTYLFGKADFVTGLEPQGLAVADFNKDGKADW